MVKAQDPIPANSEGLKKNIGYSILVRMGYKPGLGLGMNLEGNRLPSAGLWVVDLSSRGNKSCQGLHQISEIPYWAWCKRRVGRVLQGRSTHRRK